MQLPFNFKDKQVWVTGAGRGIGYQTACLFSQAGANVIGFDIAFTKTRLPFTRCLLDISDHDAVLNCCHEYLSKQKQLDILINGAGILKNGLTEEFTWQDWQQCINVNVGGAFSLFKAVIPQFKQQRHGVIISIASNAVHVARAEMSIYAASKAALRSLSLSVGLELAAFNVRCNIVSPGSTDTQMLHHLWQHPEDKQRTIDGLPEKFKLGIPLQKLAVPEDISHAIAFLASDYAGHITLQDIVIDGGATLGS